MQPTDIGEVGFWSIAGSALNMKKFFRLTSEGAESYGAICDRVPTNFENWTFDLQFRSGGGSGGKGIWFYFSDEFCPELSSSIHGTAIWFNTTSYFDMEDHKVDVYMIDNKDGQKINVKGISPVGRMPFMFDAAKTVRFTRNGKELEMQIKTSDGFISVFKHTFDGLPRMGYFSVASFTTKTNNDNNDVVSVKVTPRSPEEPIPKDFNAINRKKLTQSVELRRMFKRERRGKMATVSNYIDPKNKIYRLEDAFRMIDETEERMMDGVTADAFSDFVMDKLKKPMKDSFKRLDNEQETFTEIRDDLHGIYSDLVARLTDLGIKTSEALEQMKKNSIELVKSIDLKNSIVSGSKKDIKEQAVPEKSPISSILGIISIIETVAYLIFFVRKFRATKGFKKMD